MKKWIEEDLKPFDKKLKIIRFIKDFIRQKLNAGIIVKNMKEMPNRMKIFFGGDGITGLEKQVDRYSALVCKRIGAEEGHPQFKDVIFFH